MSFVPLHINTGYSYLKSGISINSLLNYVKKERNYNSIGISDYMTLSGLPDFFKTFKANSIKPIVGEDFIIDGKMFSVYVVNEVGYRNLIQLNTIANNNALKMNEFLQHLDGTCVVFSSKQSSMIDWDDAIKDEGISYFDEIKNKAMHFFIGIEIYTPDDVDEANYVRKFCSSNDFNPIAFPIIKYLKQDDAITLLIVEAINNDDRLTLKKLSGNHNVPTDDFVRSYYSEQEITNTHLISTIVEFELIKKRGELIKYSDNSFTLLKEQCLSGLRKKLGSIDKLHEERLVHELNIIQSMGYSDYFLVVSDFIKHARNNDILVGPGRGSAPGSLISYALDIVHVDPLQYDLLFERFLNPERKSMPDIDSDFQDTKRDEVISYICQKYGENRFAYITTIQTIGPKQALKDICRVYDYLPRDVEQLSKNVTSDTLRNTYLTNPTFRKLIDSEPEFLEIVTLASKIEGLPRQSGLHAAGIILNNTDLSKSIPVTIDSNGRYVCSYEMIHLEEQGFLKIDVLGLKNLTVVKDTIKRIKQTQNIDLDFYKIPFTDNNAIALIAQGETMGLFQLEGAGMKHAIKTINVSQFEDVVAVLALHRPGPMQNIPTYGQRKQSNQEIKYQNDALKDILSPTYGIIVYQEQIMQIVQQMASYSYGQADLFRRAISKKDASVLKNLETDFIKGCIKNGYTTEVSKKTFDLIYQFASYGFNKSHSLSYAVLACQMAYLKYYYPAEFYASVLDKNDKFSETLQEMKRRDISIKGPDINSSMTNFEVINKTLYMPLGIIKSFPNLFVFELLKERETNGLFKSFKDFVLRTYNVGLTQSVLLKLIDSGSLDTFKHSRQSLRDVSQRYLRYAKECFTNDNILIKDIDSLISAPKMPDSQDDIFINSKKEYELLGVYVSVSPFDRYRQLSLNYDAISISKCKNKYGKFKTAGLIKNIKNIKTKNDKRMAFITISDDHDELDVTLFPEVYDTYSSLLEINKCLLIEGSYDKKRESMTADKVNELEVNI